MCILLMTYRTLKNNTSIMKVYLKESAKIIFEATKILLASNHLDLNIFKKYKIYFHLIKHLLIDRYL